MRANCSSRRWPRLPMPGFTVIELVVVLVLLGIVAVTVMPKLNGITSMRGTAWRDQVVAALRHAQSQAASHRRLVCMEIDTGSVHLAMASENPSTACDVELSGPNGDSFWARDEAAPTTASSAGGALYFQPDGRVSLDGAGAKIADVGISIDGEDPITLTAQTGHAR